MLSKLSSSNEEFSKKVTEDLEEISFKLLKLTQKTNDKLLNDPKDRQPLLLHFSTWLKIETICQHFQISCFLSEGFLDFVKYTIDLFRQRELNDNNVGIAKSAMSVLYHSNLYSFNKALSDLSYIEQYKCELEKIIEVYTDVLSHHPEG